MSTKNMITKKPCTIFCVKWRLKFTAKNATGITKCGYFHFSVLGISIGRNGFGLHILGAYVGVTWGK